MEALRRGRIAAGQDTRDNHKPGSAGFLRVRGMGDCRSRVNGSRSDNNGKTCLHQPLHTLLSLCVGQQRPVTHRAAVNHCRHPRIDELLSLADELIEVWGPICGAGRHEGGDNAGEDLGVHISLIHSFQPSPTGTFTLCILTVDSIFGNMIVRFWAW
jgi:hypothetical protein